MPNPLAGRDVIAISQLTKDEIELVLAQAAHFEQRAKKESKLDLLPGRILATLFYEPSTRTRLSFETAMHRLGGDVITVAAGAKTSSVAKGETLADATLVVSSYADVIVQRHPAVGSAQEAASGATVPLINGGDGVGEHPTQALLDLFTIERERGTLDGLRVGLVGDLKHGRTVHSLSRALSHWQPTLTFISPPTLAMPAEITDELRQKEVTVRETDDLAAAMPECDVLYVTRIQRERFDDPAEYDRLKGSYVLDRALVEETNPELTIMHPLPRVNEIATDVDSLPGAAYFRQAANGVWARMAILALVLGEQL
ncbi:MAG: aspartate carbamoyltransferase [Anaerolineales bacterium]|nr:MAG: aspartate carbamoyltransferase [Anaerolineales bacterium]